MSAQLPGKFPCECGSSDARRKYENGTSFCFSCQSFFKAPPGESEEETKPNSVFRPSFKVKQPSIETISTYKSKGLPERKISKAVMDFYNVKCSFNEDGEVDTHYYPYDGGKAYKIRKLPKSFSWIGKSDNLFGQTNFNNGGKRVIITEGEIDAMSVQQANYEKYNKFYPVVAMSSATMHKSLIENREWLRSFEEVVLCLDMDKAGEAATKEAVKIVGIDKAKIAKLPRKDPSEVLLQDGGQALLICIFDAAPFIPSGIITKEELWEELVNYANTPSVPYPAFLSGLNNHTKGIRQGEISLFTSGTSCGKSTLMREIMLHLAEETDSKVGVVSLEESPAETARKLSGMALYRNPAAEEIPLDQLKVGFDQVFSKDKFIILNHQGSLNDESILNKIEYMALMGCKYIIIDHITILVSEGAGDLTGNEAIDKIMNDLLRFVKRQNVWVGLVSHLRKTLNSKKAFEEGEMPNLDDIKGSGSIKQVSFDVIGFARNLMATDAIEKNTIKMAVLKCRYTGLTGMCNGAYYDYKTGRFRDIPSSLESTDHFKPITVTEPF